MKLHFKRATSVCLLVAMVLGLFGGIPILTTSAAGSNTATDIEGKPIVNLMEGMNASFEEYSIPGWSTMEGVVQADDCTYGEGTSWALKLNDYKEDASTWSMSNKNEIKAGENYTISAQVYGGIGQMTVYFYDAEGKELSDLTVTLATAEAKNEWQTLSKDFVAEANVTHFAVKVSTTDAGKEAVYFDAVTLAVKVDYNFVLSLENGSFDADWEGAKIAPGWINKGGNKTAFERVPNGDGYALQITKPSGGGYTVRTEKFAVQGSKAYTFAINFKGKLQSSLQIYMYFYDAEGNELKMKWDEKKQQYVSNPDKTIVYGDYSSEWVMSAVNGIAPANAVSADIMFTDPSYHAEPVLFDNATITMSSGLVEPSYEGIIDSNNCPIGTTTGSRNTYVNTDPQYVRTGNKSIVASNAAQMRSYYINVGPGEEYEISVYAKREAGLEADASCGLYLYFYDASGTQIKSTFKNFKPTADGWMEMKLSYKAPDNAVTARMMFYKANGSGKVYFDDASFVQTTNYRMELNLLNNGGFEQRERIAGTNSSIAKWSSAATAASDVITQDYLGGDYGYVGRAFNYDYMTLWSQPIPIKEGSTYSVTVECRGEGRMQAYIRYFTSEDAPTKEHMLNEAGKDAGKFSSTGNMSAEWSQLAVSGSVAPAGAKYARILLCFLDDNISEIMNFQFDNVCFFEGLPKIIIPGETGVLWNLGFEEIDKNGFPVKWATFGQNRISIADANVNPDDVYEGRYALRINVPKELDGTHGAQSKPFPVQAGITYRFSLYAKEDYDEGRGFQLGIKYFNKYGDQVAAFYSTTPATGEWNYSDITGTAPDGTVYATVYLVSGAGKGTVYFDKMNFEVAGSAEYAPVMFDGDWDIAYSDYPRLDFDQERLEEMRRFAKSKSVCAYGYAGTVTMKSLLKKADAYLEETVLRVAHKEMDLEYPLYPVLEDPTARPEHEQSPSGFGPGYPYMTAVGQRLVDRTQTLALAYALTGDAKYGERARQYALDICDFEYWVGYWQTIAEGSGELSSQTTGYMLDCVIAVYDMCYDMLSQADKDKMEKNLIEKGLEAMYHDCWPRMSRDRDMDHATGMILAACTLLREDNVDQMKKYLDMGMTYINWRLNFMLKSGVNEGHMYDSLAIDDIVVTLATLERVTGYEGPMDHPYMEQLKIRVLGFFDPVNGTLPAYSDADYSSTYYPYSMAVFSQQGDELATYYLAVGGALSTDYDKMVWFTDVTLAELKVPDERDSNVNFLSAHGQGSLRTGWDILDPMLVINTNNSQQEHNHYDQNSIMLAFNGLWVLSDSEYKDNSYSELTTWQMKYTNSTIFVDGKPQVRKGQGTLEQVFNTHIYGYFLGSAPDAYGMEDKQAVLNQFDRHVIMLNHDSMPYYVVIDDLDSNKERNFGWNFYTAGWDRIEIDGENVPAGESKTGNRLTLSRFGNTLHSYFVGDQVTTREVSYAGYGPTLVLESEKAKNHQFMNVLSVQKGSGSQISTLFEHLMTGQSSTIPKNDVEGEICWSTRRTDTTKNSILSVTIGTPLVMFRAGEVGDWISFPFDVPKTKEYRVSVDVGQTMEYDGTWNLYIDDQLIEIFKPHGPLGVINIDAGYMTLEAGQHTVKVIMSGTPNSAFVGTICSIGGITLDTGESMGEGLVKVTEEYNEGDLLGATITYGPVLKDVVLFNRGTNEIVGGGLATNGQQASVIGVNGSEIAEGYAVTKGTSLKYGDVVLMTAEGPVSIAMDYTMAKFPVKNDETEDPVAIHEDFDIENPIYYVSASADAATKVSVNVGVHAPYTVMIGEQVLESTHEGEMLTFTLPEGDHQITILGTHQHVFNQYATNILNIKEWAGCGHNNTYYVSCVCGENGTETFTDGEVKGHTLKAVKAKEATETEDGNIAHYKCTKCGKLFADKAGTQELTADQVIIPNLAAEIKRQQTILIVSIVAGVVVLAGGAVALIIILKKKKATGEDQIEENE